MRRSFGHMFLVCVHFHYGCNICCRFLVWSEVFLWGEYGGESCISKDGGTKTTNRRLTKSNKCESILLVLPQPIVLSGKAK